MTVRSPVQQVDDGGPTRWRARVNAGAAIQLIQAADEKADDALASPIRGGDDIDDEFDPDIRLATCWRNQRVEAERRDVSADRVHVQVWLDRKEVSVSTLPIEREYLDAPGHDALHENEREIGLSRPASPGNEDVFLQSAALEREGVQQAIAIADGAKWDVAAVSELLPRWREWRSIRLVAVPKVLRGE